MLRFWKNPEFIRHLRADLRPARAITIICVVAVICWLVGMSMWGSHKNNGSNFYLANFYRDYYLTLMSMQGGVLAMWSLFACLQCVSGEREKKTYDFQRTTRQSSAEILIGKLLGAPMAGYFVLAITLPLSILMGLIGGVNIFVMLASYLLILMFVLLTGLAGLLVSMKSEKTSAAIAIPGFFFIYVLGMAGFEERENMMGGIAAFSPVTAIMQMHGSGYFSGGHADPWFISRHVPFYFLSTFLYLTWGAWFVLMLVRNLKTDFDEIRLLSRWQSLGFVVFINFLFFAMMNPMAKMGYSQVSVSPSDIAGMAVALNLATVGFIGLLSITPTLYLKNWYRQNIAGLETYLSENGPPWPWLLMASVTGLALLMVYAFATTPIFPLEQWPLRHAAGTTLVGTVFILRDVLFLQLCALTRMKRAVVSGFLFLALYYFAVCIFIVTAISERYQETRTNLFALFTPFASFDSDFHVWGVASMAGVAIQVAVAAVLLVLLNQRLARRAAIPGEATVAA